MSGKCFLVTSPPGVGKTTLIMRLFETLKTSNPNLNVQGFYTRKLSFWSPALLYVGVGKTTLIMRLFETLKTSNPNLNVQGFYTREMREGSERVGFEVVTLDGRKGPLASTTNSSPESLRWPTVGKYKVDVASFESLALPELQVKEDTDLFIIDEVGKMELFSSSFFPAVLRVLESNVPLLASITIPRFGRDIPGVTRLRTHPGATIFTLSTSNRDAIKDQIYSQLVALLNTQDIAKV